MNRTSLLVVSSALALASLACSSSTPEPSSPPPASPMPEAAATTPGATPVVLTTTTSPAASAAPTVAPVTPASASATAAATPAAPDKPGPVLHLTQGKVTTADADLAAADDKVRACLARSKGAGEALVKITIATSGFALSATVTPSGNVSKEAAKCARDALRDHTFGKPVGGGVAAAEGTFKVSGS